MGSAVGILFANVGYIERLLSHDFNTFCLSMFVLWMTLLPLSEAESGPLSFANILILSSSSVFCHWAGGRWFSFFSLWSSSQAHCSLFRVFPFLERKRGLTVTPVSTVLCLFPISVPLSGPCLHALFACVLRSTLKPNLTFYSSVIEKTGWKASGEYDWNFDVNCALSFPFLGHI